MKTLWGREPALILGLVAAAITLAIGHLLIAFVRPIWLKLAVAIAFVAPAALAGFHATHGIVNHLLPSDGWQMAFSIIGAIAEIVVARGGREGLLALEAGLVGARTAHA